MFEIGFSKTDISPSSPLPLGGFAGRDPAKNVQKTSPLFARVLRINDGNGDVFIISADLFGFTPGWSEEFKQKCHKSFGIEPANLFLHATHNHSAPMSMQGLDPALGPVDAQYMESVLQCLRLGIEQAIGHKKQVHAVYSSSASTTSAYRRKNIGGKIHMLPDRSHEHKYENVYMLDFMESDKLVARVMSFSGHPTIGCNYEMHYDYPGAVCKHMEEQRNIEFVMFLQGAAGDRKIDLTDENDHFVHGNFAVIENFAQMFAKQVEKNATPLCVLEEGVLKTHTQNVPLGFQTHPGSVDLTLHTLKLDKITLIGFSAELCSDLVKQLIENDDRFSVPIGYTNGTIGYLPSARQIVEKGYESHESCQFYALPDAFAPSIEEKIRQSLKQHIQIRQEEVLSQHLANISHPEMMMKKIYEQSEPVFVLSTGRSGTKYLTEILRHINVASVHHAPHPELIVYSKKAYERGSEEFELFKSIFDASRIELISDAFLRHAIYIETNNRISFFAPHINALFPRAKFIHLVRDPALFCRSGMRRNWYTGTTQHDAGRIVPLEKTGIDFNTLDRFEKIAWLWNETNQFIQDFLNTIDPTRWIMLRAEDMFNNKTRIRQILNFCSIPSTNWQVPQQTVETVFNQQTGGMFPPPQMWPDDLFEKLTRWCPLASQYGYATDKKNLCGE